MKVAFENGKIIKPSPGIRAVCHLCGGIVLARCGLQNQWHFDNCKFK